MDKEKKYVPLNEGWVGSKPYDPAKNKVNNEKIKPVDKVLIDIAKINTVRNDVAKKQ